MAGLTVLRLRRTDNKSEHLLLSVARKDPSSLDLELFGTDQQSIYHGLIAESSVDTLKASNFHADVKEWKSVLAYALLHQRPSSLLPESLQGVEAVSAVAESTVTITFRKNIGGITQRLGAIKLDRTRREIDTFEWVTAAVTDADSLRSDQEALQATVNSQKERITELTAQLEQLVTAKKQHDDELVSKCAALLNTKKRKIRDQARLLSSAQIDQDAKEAITMPRSSNRTSERQAGSSRDGKRKANGNPAVSHVETDDDELPSRDGPVDGDDVEERRRQETPETDIDEANSIDEDVDVPENSIGPANAPDDSQTRQSSRSAPQYMDVDQDEFSPSRRALPSRDGTARTQEHQPPAALPASDDDDEIEDEL